MKTAAFKEAWVDEADMIAISLGLSPAFSILEAQNIRNRDHRKQFPDNGNPQRHDKPRFRHVSAPIKTELEVLVHQISQRLGRHLKRQGLLERDRRIGAGRPLLDHPACLTDEYRKHKARIQVAATS